MTPEGETVCVSLELWKHGENEFKWNVLRSRSLTVQISTASINSISSTDPGVINIGESLTEHCGSMQKILKQQFSNHPPTFHRINNAIRNCQSLGQSSGTKYQMYWLTVCILEQPPLDSLDCLIQRTFFTLKIPLSLNNK